MNDRDEHEANYFAVCLLMPEAMIERDMATPEFAPPYDYENDPRIGTLAKRYQVSKQLMILRLIELGYIKPEM